MSRRDRASLSREVPPYLTESKKVMKIPSFPLNPFIYPTNKKGMNLLRIYGASLLVALMLGVSACKNEETPAAKSTEKGAAVTGQTISFDVDLDELPSDDFRMILEENKVNGRNTGLKFVWKTGDKEKLFLAFKTAGSNNIIVKEGYLKIEKKVGTRYKAKIEVATPAGINPDAGNVLVAGAIGVSGIDAQGRATIPGPRNFYDAGEAYTLPMYFAPTPLRSKVVKGQKEHHADDPTFHFFGAMVGATIDNTQGNMPYYPHEITMTTGALTTEGAMKLFDTESDGTKSVPKWETQQNATTTQRVYFEQGEVAIGKKHTYYFWAVPSKFSGRLPMTAEFRTDAYDTTLGATASEITTKWTVKQLANEKVHRLKADIPAPKGDLIISEVFVGGSDIGAASAWEFYNPTNQPINLKKIYIQRFDYQNGGYSDSHTEESLLWPGGMVLSDNLSIDKHGDFGVSAGMLPPHKSAIFYTAAVTNKSMTETFKRREGVAYVFHIASELTYDSNQSKYDYAKAFWIPRFRQGGQLYRARHRIIRKGKDTPWGKKPLPIDAFFYYADNRKAQYPSATFFRKPGRDLPRQQMQIRDNSDWVMRQRYEALDWGYRFSYYYDRERRETPALGIHWMEDHSTGSTIPAAATANGYIYERPIFAPDYSKDNMSFEELVGQARIYKYIPPIWWTKERAQKADR